MLASGTHDRRRRHARQGRPDRRVRPASVPVFGSVSEAVEATGANVTVIFVPAKFTKGAVVEAIEADIPLAVVITEGVPVQDTAEFFTLAQGSKHPADRPELPGPDHARAVQRRHHPRGHHRVRARSGWSASRAR